MGKKTGRPSKGKIQITVDIEPFLLRFCHELLDRRGVPITDTVNRALAAYKSRLELTEIVEWRLCPLCRGGGEVTIDGKKCRACGGRGYIK